MTGPDDEQLWETHPKLAFGLHLVVTLGLGGLAVYLVARRFDWFAIFLVLFFFLVSIGSFVLLAWAAVGDRWQARR